MVKGGKNIRQSEPSGPGFGGMNYAGGSPGFYSPGGPGFGGGGSPEDIKRGIGGPKNPGRGTPVQAQPVGDRRIQPAPGGMPALGGKPGGGMGIPRGETPGGSRGIPRGEMPGGKPGGGMGIPRGEMPGGGDVTIQPFPGHGGGGFPGTGNQEPIQRQPPSGSVPQPGSARPNVPNPRMKMGTNKRYAQRKPQGGDNYTY